MDRLLKEGTSQCGGNVPAAIPPVDGFGAASNLATRNRRLANQAGQPVSHERAIPAALWESLERLADDEAASPETCLLAAFQVLLYRYRGRAEIAIGVDVSDGGSSPDGSSQFASVRNGLLSTKITATETFLDLMRQTGAAGDDRWFAAAAKGTMPGSRRSADAGNGHSPGPDAFFHVISRGGERTAGARKTQARFENGSPHRGLQLSVLDAADGRAVRLEHDAESIDPSIGAQMLAHFERLLTGIVANPRQRLALLPLLNETERDKLLVEWNRTDVEYPRNRMIHDLVEAQAQRTPDGVAIVFDERQVTYRELNQRANQLARELRRRGVDAGTLVGIAVERSPEMVIGILGILKAGGAFVPLDPAHPAGRIAYMLGDTQVRLVITQQRLIDLLPTFAGELICLDRDRHLLDEHERGDVQRDPEPERLAYVVYTSGSTGRPKGVQGTHRGVVNYLAAYLVPTYNLDRQDVILQLPSFGFDASLRDMLGPLTAGARVVLLRQTESREPSAILSKIQDQRVTCLLSVVPSVLDALLEAAGDAPLASALVRVILVSGEPLRRATCQRARRVFGPRALIVNQYGATEATMTSTWHPVRAPDRTFDEAVVGRPIPNCRVYILDAGMNPVPAGAAGEVYIGGAGVTLGYWNRPELYAEKFVRDPFSDDPDAFLYRTGDRGEYSPDGIIRLLGRLDRQVKIGGTRVELGEIEAALLRHADVKQCAVVVRNALRAERKLISKQRAAIPGGDDPQDRRLVAYVVCPDSVETATLRTFLAHDIPAHMIPSQFIRLDRLPLNSNGKIDFAALPEPGNVRRDLPVAYAPPRNVAEAAVAEIWQEVLGIDRVGVDDGFMELGGDSLKAMRVINRLRKIAGADISVRELFKANTVSDMARSIRLRKEAEGTSSEVRAPALSRSTAAVDGQYPLSLAEQGIWFLWLMEPESPYYTCQGVVYLRGKLDHGAFTEAWNVLLSRHEILRVRFGRKDGAPVQSFAEHEPATLPVDDVSGMPAERRQRAIEEAARAEISRPFHLERDPLVRFQLFKLSDGEHALLLTMHEIIVDLWSIRIMLRDLSALYQSRLSGTTPPHRELDVNFRDFAVWESQHATRERLSGQGRYWQQQLSGELPVLNLPLDRPRPATLGYRGGSRTIVVGAALSEQLRALSRRHDATLFMTLLSAFDVLLASYSGQDDLIVGAPLANRSHAEAEDIAGFFLTMLPLRADLSGDPRFIELLDRVRDTVTGAIANADYPFIWMLEQANVVRGSNISPIFQVMFNMLSFPEQSLNSDDLELTYRSLETGYTKYDLSLYAQEHDDGIHLHLSYLLDLFDDETAERMLKNYVTLLGSIARAPESPISSLEMIDDAEKQRLLVDFNATERDFRNELCIHQLFERQVQTTPGGTALVFQDARMSYRELNERANRLAHFLRRAGVGAQTLVAVCVERSFEMMVAVLGILKAGGAYVPLDPAYPRRRLEEILNDTAAPFLCTQQSLDVFDDYGGRKIFLDADRKQIELESVSNPECVTTPGSLLQVVYTSSSTGQPKGTLITADSVLNRLYWMWDAYPFRDGDVAVLHKSYALVAASWECFGPLLAGVPTVIVSRQQLLDPAQFWKALVRHGVSYLLASPPLLRWVLEQAESHPDERSKLRLATSSAEPIAPALVKRWKNVFPGVPLLNLYGSTECSSNVTVFDTTRMNGSERRVPVGTPLPNTKVYVTDDRMNPVPIGVTGEMCVAGLCVAAGYLNLSELSKERFVPDPFCNDRHSRLYRTGDLARIRADGELELIGRRDNQVKVRGFRVELEEIEAALEQHESIRESAVALHLERAADRAIRSRLVAYFASDLELSSSSLRRFLSAALPEFMVPSEFIRLERLPRTGSGKVDRRALPEPDESRPELEVSFVPAETAAEKLLAGLWSDVLGIEQVGIHDSFFDLGGHSLQAAQLASRTSQALGTEVSVRLLIAHPTVAGLAETLDEQMAPGNGTAPASAATSWNEAARGSRSEAAPDAGEQALPTHDTYLQVESRPMLSLCMTGKLPPVDSAALGCVPRQFLLDGQTSRPDAVQAWGDGLPVLSSIAQTRLGRVAVIKLPFFSYDLYNDQQQLLDAIVDALEIAAQIGARTVSLTGLIPSATDYGRAITKRIAGRDDLPAISTGHTTTVSAVVLAIKRIIAEAGRRLEQERAGFLGLGSIGQASLRLMLKILPHPREILLCDVYSKLDALEAIRRQIQEEEGYQGPVRVIRTDGQVPDELYDATLVVGATNVPDILDVARLSPGTIIVDDSSPHCFPAADAVRRIEQSADILVTEGGVLQSPEPIHQVRYLPRAADQLLGPAARESFLRYNPRQITGCIFSSLLSSCFSELEPAVGFVNAEACLKHVDRLGELAFEAAELHCGDYVLTAESITRFRDQFGVTGADRGSRAAATPLSLP